MLSANDPALPAQSVPMEERGVVGGADEGAGGGIAGGAVRGAGGGGMAGGAIGGADPQSKPRPVAKGLNKAVEKPNSSRHKVISAENEGGRASFAFGDRHEVVSDDEKIVPTPHGEEEIETRTLADGEVQRRDRFEAVAAEAQGHSPLAEDGVCRHVCRNGFRHVCRHGCRHGCRHVYRSAYRYGCEHMCVSTFVGIRVGMCADTGVDMCVDIGVDVCICICEDI